MYEKISNFLGLMLIIGIYGLFFYGILYHSILSAFGKAVVIWFFTALTLFVIFHTISLKKKGFIE
jgi:hypothetical protein|nr:MAG TPA: hypothetical protein [Caudoviricetes sp.]